MLPKENLDDRTFEDLVAECILRIPRYCPEWTDFNPSDPGITLVELFAWLTDQMLMRFNKVPRRNYITFLELLGIKLQPPAPAQTDVSFYITQPDIFPYSIPQGTEIGTERTETEAAIIFSTEQDLLIGQPEIIYLLTAETVEERPNVLLDRLENNRWNRENNGAWGGEELPLFNEQPEVDNCFYLVFNAEQPLAGNAIAVMFRGAAAQPAGIDPLHPPRTWSAWDGTKWVESILMREEDDYTGGFSFDRALEDEDTMPTAEVVVHLPPNLAAAEFQGYEGYWLRCVYTTPETNQNRYQRAPKITGIDARPVGGSITARQSWLIRDELLGISDGRPGQSFSLQNIPVLERRSDEFIEVIPPGSLPQRWQEVRDFASSTPSDRHYTIDALTGTVEFGPLIQEPSCHVQETKFRATQTKTQLPVLGNYSTRLVGNIDGTLEKQYGRVPPKGAKIRMRCYRSGGGRQGNIESGKLKILKSAIPYIARVTNYQPARGGSDPESLNQAMLRAPQILRTRDRAVTKEDFEVLALKAGGGVNC